MSTFHPPQSTRFTEWLVREGHLSEQAVFCDVGVSGGFQSRWRALGDRLTVSGFDLDQGTINDLAAKASPHEKYFCIALGAKDGEGVFFRRPRGHDHSMLRPANPEPLSASAEDFNNRMIVAEERIALARVDSLVAGGRIPAPHFLKIDTEGFELDVLEGLGGLLDSVYAVELETCFAPTERYPERPYFFEMYDWLSAHGFEQFDIATRRVSGKHLRRGPLRLVNDRLEGTEYGTIGEADVLWINPRIFERSDLSPQEVLRIAVFYELYNFADRAIDLLMRHEDKLSPLLPFRTARDLLIPPLGDTALTYEQYQDLALALDVGLEVERVKS